MAKNRPDWVKIGSPELPSARREMNEARQLVLSVNPLVVLAGKLAASVNPLVALAGKLAASVNPLVASAGKLVVLINPFALSAGKLVASANPLALMTGKLVASAWDFSVERRGGWGRWVGFFKMGRLAVNFFGLLSSPPHRSCLLSCTVVPFTFLPSVC